MSIQPTEALVLIWEQMHCYWDEILWKASNGLAINCTVLDVVPGTFPLVFPKFVNYCIKTSVHICVPNMQELHSRAQGELSIHEVLKEL